MPRLMGVDVPGKKHARFALRYIHGIGPKRADDVLAACKVDPSKKADDLTQDEIHAIVTYIQEHFRVEGDLRREVSQNIRRLISIGSYRGLRHKRGLPVRGQRTRTNAKTRKGGRRSSAAVIRVSGFERFCAFRLRNRDGCGRSGRTSDPNRAGGRDMISEGSGRRGNGPLV